MYNPEGYRKMYADEVENVISDMSNENERLKDKVELLESTIENYQILLDDILEGNYGSVYSQLIDDINKILKE